MSEFFGLLLNKDNIPERGGHLFLQQHLQYKTSVNNLRKQERIVITASVAK